MYFGFIRRRVLGVSALLVLGTAPACSATDAGSSSAAAAAEPDAAAGDGAANEAPDPVRAACDAQTAELARALDRAHRATTDAVLAVKDPSCGLRVLTSGPSKHDGTELHRIGSVTKTYVAAVVLDLAREGALSLTEPVAEWVSGVPNGESITIRQLLEHTSGLFNYTEDAEFMRGVVLAGKATTPRALVDVAAKHEPYAEPGAEWHYSNTNYILLGMIAEAAAGQPIAQLIRTRLLEKAKLGATFFDGEEPLGGTLAKGRSARGKDVTHLTDPSWAWAAGAIVAAPGDVISWIEQLGKSGAHDTSPVPTGSRGLSYGLGAMIFDPSITGGAGRGVGHTGGIMGYGTQAFYFPDSRTTMVSIVDSDAESPNEVTAAALGVLFSP